MSRPLRVAFVLPAPMSHRGGAELWVRTVADYLTSRGTQVDVWMPALPRKSCSPTTPGREREYPSWLYLLLQRLNLLSLFPFLVPYRKEWDGYDVVYTTSMHPFRIYLQARTRVVVGTHDSFVLGGEHGTDRYHLVSALRQAVSVLLLRVAKRERVSIHAVSAAIADRMRASQKRIYAIPNFAPREDVLPEDSDDFVVSYIGQVSRRKGGDILCALAPRLTGRPDLDLVVIGLIRPEYQTLVASRGSAPNLHILGPAPDEEKYAWLAKSSASLFLSSREAAPFAILESLSVGVPVICTWTPAARVFPGPGILSVEPTMEGVLAAINQLASRRARSPREYRTFRENIRKGALESFGRVRVLESIRAMLLDS